jgi:hypothetical protein
MTSPAINAAIPQARSSSAIRRRFPSRASAFVTCASHECHLMPASLRAQDVCTTLDHNESPTEPFKWLRDPSQSPCAAAALDVEARLAYGFDGVVFATSVLPLIRSRVDVALVYKHEKMDGGLINSQLAHFRVHVADPADRRAEDGQRASDPVFPPGLRRGVRPWPSRSPSVRCLRVPFVRSNSTGSRTSASDLSSRRCAPSSRSSEPCNSQGLV